MKRTTLAVLVALTGLAAACERDAGERTSATPPPQQQAGTGGTAPQSNTPSTPANVGAPQSQAEKREGANPVQGQVDPKQSEQHKDFKTKGDAAGPTSPDTQPKPGG
jgi:hypothetical protein